MNGITSFFITLLDLILEPIHSVLENAGLNEKLITIGFGEVQWFQLSIVELVDLFIILIIVLGFWKIIYNFFKWLINGLIRGWR